MIDENIGFQLLCEKGKNNQINDITPKYLITKMFGQRNEINFENYFVSQKANINKPIIRCQKNV